jgi:hypothetical protein
MVVKRVTIPSQPYRGKCEREIVVLARLQAIDKRVVGETQKQGQMPVTTTLSPDAIRFRPVCKGLLMVGTGHAPRMPGGSESGRSQYHHQSEAKECRSDSCHPGI